MVWLIDVLTMQLYSTERYVDFILFIGFFGPSRLIFYPWVYCAI